MLRAEDIMMNKADEAPALIAWSLAKEADN